MESHCFDPRRAAVVAEAHDWLRTPYHHMGRVKGAGTDCLTFLAEVYERAGVLPHLEIAFYPPDWHLHRGEERYLDGLLGYAREIEGPPQPGDIAMWRYGRCFAHAAIVVAWPQIIHAAAELRMVSLGDASQGQLARRAVRFFDPFIAAERQPVN
jgi:cell wall-associated NlpC family hydrolase